MDQVEASAYSIDVHQDENSSNDSGNPQATDLKAAVAAGRARAVASQQDTLKIGLDRLVASSGFGRVHRVQVVAKPHQMVGHNVTITKDAPPSGTTAISAFRNRGEGSFDASNHMVPCQISIAPVVAASHSHSVDTAAVSDMESAKRRKHHPGLEQEAHRRNNEGKEVTTHHRRHPHRQLVTHYVLQLESLEGKAGKHESLGSLSSSSTSVEARLVGLTKAELDRQRLAANIPLAHEEPEIPDEDEGELEESTEPVAAIG
jgi:hypothetical protein